MARQVHDRDISKTLAAAQEWIGICLIEDQSILSDQPLWTAELVDEVYHAFVEHLDYGEDDFMTKLKRQMKDTSPPAQQLMAEMLWALLLFPSNVRPSTKRRHVNDIWALSKQPPAKETPLSDDVLAGIGSGGPGFNNHRWRELVFLITLTRDLKRKERSEREKIFADYDAFVHWIASVHQEGRRQFRHMLRYFAFPERVERIASDGERKRILEAFGFMSGQTNDNWTDRQVDDALLKLRSDLTKDNPSEVMDFYMPKYRERWAPEPRVRTLAGEVVVSVPDEEEDSEEVSVVDDKAPEPRQSIQVQAQLAEIGAIMGFRVWLPTADRAKVRELMKPEYRGALIEDHLPLSYDTTTLLTIERIDVLWLDGRSIVRAFEVEHTTAVYSGLLRMADLLALIPNMDIRLHIVAPEERREKVFSELLRPVFSLVNQKPLSRRCTFISYDNVAAIRDLEHLAYTHDRIIDEYEEAAGS